MFQTLLLEVATDAPADGFMLYGQLLFIPLIIVVFYFFMIRPENKKKKKAKQMRDELIVSDEITTIGGIVGRVVQIKDDEIVIETGSDKSRIKIKRWAVSTKDEKISE